MAELVKIYPILYKKVPNWLKKQLEKRDEKGWLERNQYMCAFDGRNMKLERHEELLDALVYQQTVEVEEGKTLVNWAMWRIIRLLLSLSEHQMRP